MPQPNKHEGQDWWAANCSRAHAEELLRKASADGAFLVRPSEKDQGCYAISFRYVAVSTLPRGAASSTE